MGFTTGLLGGFTLTSAIIYVSITSHARTRLQQSALVQQQARLVNNIVDPQPLGPPPTSREVRAGVLDSAKDRWNAELEREVRVLQNIDWRQLWDNVEEGISSAYRRAFEKGREVAPDPPKRS